MDLKAQQDRIHAINQTISGVNAIRYFPQKIDSAESPAIFSVPGRFQRDVTRTGANQLDGRRQFTLFLVGREFTSAIPTTTAQQEIEVLIGTIWDTYEGLKRLDLNHTPLTGVKGSQLISDSGLVPYRFNNLQSSVEFILEVTIHRSY